MIANVFKQLNQTVRMSLNASLSGLIMGCLLDAPDINTTDFKSLFSISGMSDCNRYLGPVKQSYMALLRTVSCAIGLVGNLGGRVGINTTPSIPLEQASLIL